MKYESAASYSALPPALLLTNFQVSSLISLNSGTPESVIKDRCLITEVNFLEIFLLLLLFIYNLLTLGFRVLSKWFG